MTSTVFDLINKHQKEKDARKGGFRPTGLPSGQSIWRILPHAKDIGELTPTRMFHHDYAQHFLKVPGTDETTVYVCETETFGRPCAVCEEVRKELYAISTWDKVKKKRDVKPGYSEARVKQVEDFRAKPSVLVNALRIDVPGSKPEIISLPSVNVWKQIVAKAQRRFEMTRKIDASGRVIKEGVLAFSTAAGVNVIISRTGTGIGTKYEVDMDSEVTAVHVNPAEVADLEATVRASSAEALTKSIKFLSGFTGRAIALPPAASAAAGAISYAEPEDDGDLVPAGAFSSSMTIGDDESTHAISEDVPPFDLDVPDAPAEVVAQPAADLNKATTVRTATPAAPAATAGISPGLLADLAGLDDL